MPIVYRILAASLSLTVSASMASVTSARGMVEISKRWSCEFKTDPQMEKLQQGIECTVENLCSHPTQQNPLTFTELDEFRIDFGAKTLSYVASERWFPSARERIRAKLKAEGRKDETGKLEHESQNSFKIRDVFYSKPDPGFIPEITTITYAGEDRQIAMLTIIDNGKKAIITRPIAIGDHLSIVHYFGSCYPE